MIWSGLPRPEESVRKINYVQLDDAEEVARLRKRRSLTIPVTCMRMGMGARNDPPFRYGHPPWFEYTLILMKIRAGSRRYRRVGVAIRTLDSGTWVEVRDGWAPTSRESLQAAAPPKSTLSIV